MKQKLIVAVFVAVSFSLRAAEEPRAAQARKVLEAWRAVEPEPAARRLHIVSWRSHDSATPSNQLARIRGIMEHIREFYAREMERTGFGRLTFGLTYDQKSQLVIHEAVGDGASASYQEDGPSGARIKKDCAEVLRRAGINPDRNTVLIFTNLADYDPVKATFSHHSPYMGGGDFRAGTAWQLDHAGLAAENLKLKEPKVQDRQYGHISLGKHNSIFIGGIAHELGHALGLPHCREAAAERKTNGHTLMGDGNRSYGDELRGEGKGSFLSLDSAMRLASHPLFTGSIKGYDAKANANLSALSVTNIAGGFAVSGVVKGSLPVYALVAYLDPEGGSDYDARTAVAVPDADGKFTLNCTELVADKPAQLRIVSCMVNGATSRAAFVYTVAKDGAADTGVLAAEFAKGATK